MAWNGSRGRSQTRKTLRPRHPDGDQSFYRLQPQARQDYPSPPSIEQTGVSSGDSVARQRTPVGDPLNNEQWSDHLSDPPSY